MAELATINQRIQIAKETTPGTSVPANKLLTNMTASFAPNTDVKTYRGTGRRWPSTAIMNREWVDLKWSGDMDYQDIIYPIAGVWSAVTATTHATGTLSKDWIWTPPVSGSIVPATYTVEQGDANRAHKIAYGLFQGFSYKGTRKDGFTFDGDMIAQIFQDSITLTSSPTAVALSPLAGSHVNLYIDVTSAGLGGTKFTRAFSFEYAYSNGFDGFWPLDRANPSFAGHVDTVPKNTVKFLLEADAAGMGLLPHLRLGDYLYVRFDAVGPIIETTIPYAFQHDMAVKLTDIGELKDEDGIYATEYSGEIAEDPTWLTGTAQKLTVTNLLSSL